MEWRTRHHSHLTPPQPLQAPWECSSPGVACQRKCLRGGDQGWVGRSEACVGTGKSAAASNASSKRFTNGGIAEGGRTPGLHGNAGGTNSLLPVEYTCMGGGQHVPDNLQASVSKTSTRTPEWSVQNKHTNSREELWTRSGRACGKVCTTSALARKPPVHGKHKHNDHRHGWANSRVGWGQGMGGGGAVQPTPTPFHYTHTSTRLSSWQLLWKAPQASLAVMSRGGAPGKTPDAHTGQNRHPSNISRRMQDRLHTMPGPGQVGVRGGQR
jgi:hypothetical protein